ncbi:hypothetical protein [Streptosporangium sp. NPDC000396]|uniref:hypothetical protein n=1 Tax=Streptosporangium sp. NPDC000396 TaxID=3366185 RepID=UPI0036CDAD39
MLRKLVLAAVCAAGLPIAVPPAWAGDSCPTTSPCAVTTCGPGRICVPSPKQCVTTPCPQYDCVSVIPLPMMPATAPRPRIPLPMMPAPAPRPMIVNVPPGTLPASDPVR